eukprot:94157-Chlamydomonas_euryale.AAC.3
MQKQPCQRSPDYFPPARHVPRPPTTAQNQLGWVCSFLAPGWPQDWTGLQSSPVQSSPVQSSPVQSSPVFALKARSFESEITIVESVEHTSRTALRRSGRMCMRAMLYSCSIYVAPALLYALPETGLTDQQLQPLVSAHNAFLSGHRHGQKAGCHPPTDSSYLPAAGVPQLMHILNAARLTRLGRVARMPDAVGRPRSTWRDRAVAALCPVLASRLAGWVWYGVAQECAQRRSLRGSDQPAVSDPRRPAELNTCIPVVCPLPVTLTLTLSCCAQHRLLPLVDPLPVTLTLTPAVRYEARSGEGGKARDQPLAKEPWGSCQSGAPSGRSESDLKLLLDHSSPL